MNPTPRLAAWLAPLLLATSLFPVFAPSAIAETIYKYTNSQGDTVFTDQPTKGAQKITIDPPPVIPLTPINLPPSTPTTPTAPVMQPAPAPQSGAQPANAPLIPPMQMQPPATSLTGAPSATPGVPALPAGDHITALPDQPHMIRSPLPTDAVPQVAPNGHYQSLRITQPVAGPVAARDGGTIFVQTQLTPPLDVTAGDRMRLVIDGNVRVDDSTGQRFMLNNVSNGSHTLIAIVMRHGQNIFQSNPVVIQVTGGTSP